MAPAPQYVCLELLDQMPGLFNAELARRTFVTRQSMNLVLRGLQDRGLITRPDVAAHGRARPTELTAAGRRRLLPASVATRTIERQMLVPLTATERRRLLDDLTACAEAVSSSSEPSAERDGRRPGNGR